MSSCTSRVVFALLLLAVGPLDVLGATPEPCTQYYESNIKTSGEDAERVYIMLNDERQSGCVLGTTDTTGIRALYLELQQAQDAEKAEIRGRLFDAVIGQFDGLTTGSCEAASNRECMVGRQVQALQKLRHLFNAGTPDRKDPLLQFNSWFPVEAEGTIAISNVNLSAFLNQDCASGLASEQCAAAVSAAAKLMRSGLAMDQLIASYNQPLIDANTKFLTRNDREWDNYLNTLSVQYPWELALNSWRFSKAVPRDARAQFPRAPTSKLIALHPSPGFEYVNLPDNSRSAQAAIIVELIGIEKWQWRDGDATNRWGASIAAAFVDAQGMDSVGYGVFVRTPFRNASVGVVWRDGANGWEYDVLVNFDLAKLIKQYHDIDLKEFLRAGQ